jgi:hypothetical protein
VLILVPVRLMLAMESLMMVLVDFRLSLRHKNGTGTPVENLNSPSAQNSLAVNVNIKYVL